MPVNTGLSGLFQTVVTALTDASKLLAPTHELMNCIYWNYNSSEPGVIGQTYNVPIPTDPTSNVQNVGTGDRTLSAIGITTTSIVLNQNLNLTWAVRLFEQFNSPEQIKTLYMDAALKGFKNSCNAAIASLFSTVNFTTNTAISTTGGIITVPQFLQGQAVLMDQYVPTTDVENMFLVTPSVPYTKMMDGTAAGSGAAWAQALIVGSNTASTIHENGRIPVAFSTQIKLDQQMPTTGAAASRTFTPALFHRYAVAGITRPIPMPPEAAKVVDYAYIPFGDLMLLVEAGYNQYPLGAEIVTLSSAFGLKVVRENMCQLFSTAE